jgi:hypothetical protein
VSRTLSAATLGLCVAVSVVRATAEEPKASLAAEARDPTASILALQLRYDLVVDFHDLDDDETLGTFLVQPVIPFKTGPLSHIGRVTVPIVTHSPKVRFPSEDEDIFPGLPFSEIRAGGAAGLADIALLDVVVFEVPGGRLGVGPVTTLPTATDSDLGSKQWTLGPAGVAMLKSGPIQYGALVQGFFHVLGDDDREDVNQVSLQPLFSYALPNDWSIGVSEMSFVRDLERTRWSSLPLGVNVDKLVTIGEFPVRLAFQTEYNFQGHGIAPAWTLRFIVTPLFPLGG